MLAHLVAICWPMLTHVEPKDPKNGDSKKDTVKRRIFWWSAAYLGAMLAHLGAMLAHLGAMLAHLGAMLAHLGGYVRPSWRHGAPSWGYLGPSWALCWPILGLCWPILRPMLAHVDPSWATRSEKWEKMGRAQNTVKRDCFWRPGVSAAGAAAPLSYGEERNAFGYATARGPLAGFKRLRTTAGQGPMLRWYGSSWEQDRKGMLPHLEAMLVHLGAMLAHLGAMLARLGA